MIGAKVSFYKARADVVYDPAKVWLAEMIKALKKTGYRGSVLGGIQKNHKVVVIQMEKISGFDKIPPLEEAIRKVPGVKGVRTDFLKRKVTVTIEAGKGRRDALLAAVAGQGMKGVIR